ncbi:MAG: hypothetical protein LBC09_02055 [Helicobacteraceae bacterium]|jgi:ligand-binding sensor domain-containing protein|nr:hypothetical protein [Helicobacteraceae bacterium]
MFRSFLTAFISAAALFGADFVMVEAGSANAFLVDSEGGLWAKYMAPSSPIPAALGLGEDRKYRPDFERVDLNARVVKLSTDQTNTVVLDDNGEIWIAGYNYFGKSGSAELLSFTKIPLKTKISEIASGWGYALIVDNEGVLYAAGCNDRGGARLPVIKIEGETRFTKVAASKSEYEAIAIDRDGGLWSAEGIISNRCARRFKQVKTDAKFQAVYAGDGTHFALIDRSGALWEFYNGSLAKMGGVSDVADAAVHGGYRLALDKNGVLWIARLDKDGKPKAGDEGRFTQVDLGVKITAIASGFTNSFALDSEGALWTTSGTLLVKRSPEYAKAFSRFPQFIPSP